MVVRPEARIDPTIHSLTCRLTLRRWLFNPRRFARSVVKYSRIPTTDNGSVPTELTNATPKSLLSNPRTIIHEDDPQDDLLLSL
ncbi:unnamed protein product [Dicrocoelium dendriticum]|nr:unnamed protein product [Dicrocoelium dendriticum]